MNPLFQSDLDHILEHTHDLWETMHGENLFITGGTGFFGVWLTESFLWANKRLNLKASATLLSRNPEKFINSYPHIANDPSLTMLRGDIRNFDFPPGQFGLIIHAAAEVNPTASYGSAIETLATIMEGTQRILNFSNQCRAKRLLFISSGAVYGKQPSDISRIAESYPGAPDSLDVSTAYGQGKRLAEFLCATQHAQTGLDVKIARCFAFIGPHLPLDRHYAVGNFISDALRGNSIQITGDGSALRSYLYAADLAIWLWTLLLNDKSDIVYNVGSENANSIAEIAGEVVKVLNPELKIQINNNKVSSSIGDRYIPSTRKAREELKLEQWIDFTESIRRTAMYVTQ